MHLGFCYIPDRHPEVHGDWATWYARLVREWRLADELGFDSIWIAEHRLANYGFGSLPVVAQAIASATRRIRVGTAVSLLSQRHPVLTAEDWAAVDVLSGGRLSLGIGRGSNPHDFEVVGVPSGESRERFEEAWSVVRRLWTEDDVAHEGRFWRFPRHTLGPKPVQRPTPPVYVACVATPESYDWAGRHGFHVMVSPWLLDSTDRQREYLDRYRAALAAAGHDPARFEVLANYHLAIVERPDQQGPADEHFFRYVEFLRNLAAPRKLDRQAYANYAPGRGTGGDVHEMRRERCVIGSAAACVDRMRSLAASCGFTGWMLHVNYGAAPEGWVIEQMHALKELVAPALRS